MHGNMKRFITFTLAFALLLFGAGFAEAAIYRNYNLGDDNATNYEVGEAVWTGNVFQVKTRAGGSGTLRSLQLMTGASAGIVIDSGGFVGVGTSTPSEALHVQGNVRIKLVGTGSGIYLKPGANSSSPNLIGNGGNSSEKTAIYGAGNVSVNLDSNNNGSGETFTVRRDAESGGTIVFTVTDGGVGSFTNVVTVGTPTAAGHAATKSYVDSAVTGGVAGSEFWKLSGSNLYTSSTSWLVGIGATPTSSLRTTNTTSFTLSSGEGKLQIMNSSAATSSDSLILRRTGSPNTHSTGILFSDVNSFQAAIRAKRTSISSNYNSDLLFYTGDGSADFQDESDVRMVITYDGKVGIGTTGPQATLHVAGDSIFSTAVSSGGLKIQTTDVAGNNSIRLFMNEDDTANLYGFSWIFAGSDNPTFGGTAFTLPQNFLYLIRHTNSAAGAIAVTVSRDTGNVGIADSTPTEGVLTVGGTGYFNNTVTVGTPTAAGHAATKSYVDSAVTSGTASSSANSAACSADATCEVNAINAQGGNITGVNKLTVTTIDPLYQIGDKKYSTYASAIAGGVKEEYVGTATLSRYNKKIEEYEYVVDFDAMNDGSSLWVWRKTVEFGKDTVQALMTPYGRAANLYYLIEGNTLVFRGDQPAEFSYRLVGNRFDWRDWPTLANDQAERPSLIVK